LMLSQHGTVVTTAPFGTPLPILHKKECIAPTVGSAERAKDNLKSRRDISCEDPLDELVLRAFFQHSIQFAVRGATELPTGGIGSDLAQIRRVSMPPNLGRPCGRRGVPARDDQWWLGRAPRRVGRPLSVKCTRATQIRKTLRRVFCTMSDLGSVIRAQFVLRLKVRNG
jgi:hypothetical protein